MLAEWFSAALNFASVLCIMRTHIPCLHLVAMWAIAMTPSLAVNSNVAAVGNAHACFRSSSCSWKLEAQSTVPPAVRWSLVMVLAAVHLVPAWSCRVFKNALYTDSCMHMLRYPAHAGGVPACMYMR
jgi:hypothetical protein